MNFTKTKSVRICLDTNILAYADGVNEPHEAFAAIQVLEDIDGCDVLVPIQALAELFSVLVRKLKLHPEDARLRVTRWRNLYPLIDTDWEVIAASMLLTATHKLRSWDAIVFASAAAAGCDLLLSEDLQHGFTWRGVTVRNPFKTGGALGL